MEAETEKTGHAHVTSMTNAAWVALDLARRCFPGIGEAPVLPAQKDPQPMSRHLTTGWWKEAERLADLERKAGRGWHSLRRKFASDLKGVPLKTLQELGGWKTHQTILMCYQHVDEGVRRAALANRHIGS